ncbi:DUF1015 family protein [Paracrocinitomix mangrovi]|uniref:DUF1015 domain-containing protein n=1 Tax=Paracrocinitomix mangrovi TaxID=2862509 RepID=UPI001C8E2CEA|nr:DUF1015 family protein [Paracrocinitomix mangrovi]UKN02453.1 DUF1015 family protein [Paracrocinitomix mangrovi]
MSILVPFKAIRPQADKAEKIVSRPYDVLNSEEARAEAEGNPISFYRVIKPEIDFPVGHDEHATEVYQKGAENFKSLMDQGVMVQDDKENFYAYEIKMGDHVQTGLVGCCAIDDYFNNNIKKHELTRPDKEEDRKNHVRYSQVNYEPVFFSYPHVDDINVIVNKYKQNQPLHDITTIDGIRHKLWVIDGQEDIDSIQLLFDKKVPSIYIADGHHRTAAGALVGKEFREKDSGTSNNGKRYNYFMAVLFPDNELKIIDYNRVVKDLNDLSEEEFIGKIEASFNVEKVSGQAKPGKLHEFGMYLNGSWYKLSAKDGTFDDKDPVGVLDVTILSNQVLEPILGIKDLRTDNRIEFVGGIRGLGELEKRVDSGEMKVAFAMFPVSMQQLIDISDNDMIMPPKVTWFEPKLRSGLFVHDISE